MLQFLLTLVDESEHSKIEHIYNTYHEYMIKCAAAKLRNMGRTNYLYDAEDAVQNTFMKITKHISKIDFSRGEKDVKNYCLAILTNEICNVLSYNKEDYEVDEELDFDDNNSFSEMMESREQYNEIVDIIDSMDERYSTTLFLNLCKEMTPDEIAKLMGISVKTVYTRITRGRLILQDLLKGANIDG